ncbi:MULTISPECIES: HAMP domain-containing histidine kinase [Bacillaceae]|uniref:histidine kinase n=1 Tax=Evansella alkalicola TaxID=745819 RepID=A0ABS6JT49_9BACI|nr:MULTISPECIES: HAMP domain-containing histidine kinase [Bacillaceae]MBU9721742.1 HAMP domain-containing histidine kinase [Bacillus alkalicola]
MASESALLFNIVNEDNKSQPGLVIIDPSGIIRYLNEEGSRLLNKKVKVRQGDNIYDTPLAPYFYNLNSTKTPVSINLEQVTLDYSYNKKEEELLVGSLVEENPDVVFPEKNYWDSQTERLVQQLSLRYAHEILNALTPVYGILQMMKKDTATSEHTTFLELAQREIEKGKNYVNDFLNINYPMAPRKTYIRAGELQECIKVKIEEQAPEFTPHLSWEFVGKRRSKVQVDVMQLRLIIQLLVKKWIDFAKCPSTIQIIFNSLDPEKFIISMNMVDEDGIPFEIDDEFDYYLHLTKKLLRKSGGELFIEDGLTIEYYFEDEQNLVR